MAKRLLDRQVSLLHYLTSGGAVFGGKDGGPPDPALQGIDPGLLKLEARFSHDKRMEKIAGVFRRTFELMGDRREMLTRAFIDACPPADIGRLENARQFFDFLSVRWQDEPPTPPYLPDVAACELAFAAARVAVEDRVSIEGLKGSNNVRIRRAPAVMLLRSAYDIRPVFEDAAGAGEPVKRDTPLAIVPQAGAAQPAIFELAPEVFDLLAALEDWTDRAAFGGEAGELIADLSTAGLVETGR
jgi:hypothetical protein